VQTLHDTEHQTTKYVQHNHGAMRVAVNPTVSVATRQELGLSFVRSTNRLEGSALQSTAVTPSKATNDYEVGLKSRNGLVFALLCGVPTADARRPKAASRVQPRNSFPFPEHKVSVPQPKQAVTGYNSQPDQSTQHRHNPLEYYLPVQV
jgi:hypothetical protein